MLTSLIIPCYNEEAVLPLLWCSLREVTEELREKSEFEFIFVDDGSKDGTLNRLKELAAEDGRVTYLSFPEISARRRPCTPACAMPGEITRP